MKRFFALFWILFILYFIFAHPAIIYYHTDYSRGNLVEVNPSIAFFYLGLSVLLWGVVFLFTFFLLIKNSFVARGRMEKLMLEGKRLNARIVGVKPEGKQAPNETSRLLTLEFENLEGETVRHDLQVQDSESDEGRYATGKTVYLRLDESLKKAPYVVLEGSVGKVRPWYFLIWTLFLAAVLYYYNFSYDLENAGYGWRFMTLGHPLIVSPGCIVFFTAIVYLFLRFLIFPKMNIGRGTYVLKFKGRRARAKVTNVTQTGTYINEQPEVKFDVEFEAGGQVRRSTITKIVPLVDIGLVKTESEKTVFYDPKEQTNVLFEEDVNS
ncbi:hypothetical protein [Arcticibacter sp. MXS-1]|uniref:hypothetical protein n=1 Tax=Arcticibacter sp. MXS-1 TaxID=3341726 RepID=UPI0035A89B9A